jgi:hypothetical protein
LNQLLAAQPGGTARPTADLSGCGSLTRRRSGSSSKRTAITQRRGILELTRLQSAVARVLSLLGVDQILTVRDQAGAART